jgi:hypothetical protein
MEMCQDFGSILVEKLFEVSLIKEKALEKEVISNGFMCRLKRDVLDCYVVSVKNLMISVSNACQRLEVIRGIDDLEAEMREIKALFRKNGYGELYEKVGGTACPKTLYLFETMQSQLEDMVINNIRFMLLRFIGSPNGEKVTACAVSLDLLVGLFESSVLHLAGLRLNCENIDSSILKEIKTEFTHHEAPSEPGSACYICKDHQSCIYNNGSPVENECIHLFLHEDLFMVKGWVPSYIDLYHKFHKYPEKITFVLDFKLLPRMKMPKEYMEFFFKMEDKFGMVYYINCDHIDFNGNRDKLQVIEWEKIKECF